MDGSDGTRHEWKMRCNVSLSLFFFFFLSFFSVSLTLSRSFFHSWMLLRVKERWREDCSVSIPFSRVRCKSNNCVEKNEDGLKLLLLLLLSRKNFLFSFFFLFFHWTLHYKFCYSRMNDDLTLRKCK